MHFNRRDREGDAENANEIIKSLNRIFVSTRIVRIGRHEGIIPDKEIMKVEEYEWILTAEIAKKTNEIIKSMNR